MSQPVPDDMDELYRIPFMDGWHWVKPIGSEQHAADWSAFIAPVPKGWRVVFGNEVLDLCRTREEARVKVREYKGNPDLATAAAVLSL